MTDADAVVSDIPLAGSSDDGETLQLVISNVAKERTNLLISHKAVSKMLVVLLDTAESAAQKRAARFGGSFAADEALGIRTFNVVDLGAGLAKGPQGISVTVHVYLRPKVTLDLSLTREQAEGLAELLLSKAAEAAEVEAQKPH